MPAKEEIDLPEGWKWDQDWTVDMNRGVDDEGIVFYFQRCSIPETMKSLGIYMTHVECYMHICIPVYC